MKSLRLEHLVLGLSGLLFFVSASLTSFNLPWVFNSPDENANATFAAAMQNDWRLYLSEPINPEVGGLLHPRSVIAVGVKLVPGSFLGLPLTYGLVAKLIGLELLRWLTPLLAIAAVFAWRRIVEVIFGSRSTALVAGLMLMFHPAWWYWSGRPLMHNVPTVALLIFAVYVGIVRPRWMFLCGLLAGLAIFFRGFEAIWLIPLVTILLIRFRQRIGDSLGIAQWFAGLVLALLPMMILNHNLYGSSFLTGYTYSAPTTIETVSSASLQLPLFTFHFPSLIKSILRNSWNFSVALFPWLSLGAAWGFLIVVGERRRPRRVAPTTYAILSVVITVYLWIFYGSWNFADNPDLTLATIGESYTRYWLPIFVLTTPFLATLVVWLGSRAKTAFARGAAIGVMTFLLGALSIGPVFFAEDGLIQIRQNLLSFEAKRQRVLALTEEEAIIVVDRADKFLWPARRVVQPLRSEVTYAALPKLAAFGPLYYFGITFPPADLDYLNKTKLPLLGFTIELVETINDESLYRLRSFTK